MAQLRLVEPLQVLQDIERKAEGYTVITVLSSIALNIMGIYAGVYLSTQIWRFLACPC